MKSKVTFLIPYFGKLPDYFDLFLKSCKYNGGGTDGSYSQMTKQVAIGLIMCHVYL